MMNNHRIWKMMSMPLPINHFVVLFFLESNGSMTISEIAQSLSISKQQMSPIIDKLEKKELIAKKNMAKDKRFIQARLTRKGKSLLENHRKKQKVRLMEHMKKLSVDDVEIFKQSSQIVKKSIETIFK